MRTTAVVILGGGLAGLNVARLLHSKGRAFELFEARERLGGRVFTVDHSGHLAADGFDLGPSWFWPAAQPAMGALVSELGLAAFPQHGDGDVVVERSLAAAPRRVSSNGSDGSMRIAGGSNALVQALAAKLPPASVHLDSPVTSLSLVDDGVVITIARPGAAGPETIKAERVVSTLPPRLFAEAVRLDPPMEAATTARWRATATWMAPHAKFYALYDKPFWREAGLCGLAQSRVGPMGEVHDATTASGAAALFGFVGITAAERAAMGEEALKKAAVEQLVRLFGPEAGHPKATLLKDWATDPYTATKADAHASGHPMPSGLPWVTGAWAKDQRLIFAGSETSRTEPGYLAGAVEASTRVAAALEKLPLAAVPAHASDGAAAGAGMSSGREL